MTGVTAGALPGLTVDRFPKAEIHLPRPSHSGGLSEHDYVEGEAILAHLPHNPANPTTASPHRVEGDFQVANTPA